MKFIHSFFITGHYAIIGITKTGVNKIKQCLPLNVRGNYKIKGNQSNAVIYYRASLILFTLKHRRT